MTVKKKEESLAKRGAAGLLAKLGSPEAVTAHYKRLGKRRWAKHPEQRSEAYRAKKAARTK